MMGIGTGYPYNPMLIPPVGPSYTVYPVDQGQTVQLSGGYQNSDPGILADAAWLNNAQSQLARMNIGRDIGQGFTPPQIAGAAGTNAPMPSVAGGAVPLAPTPAGQPMQLGQRYPAPAPQKKGKGGVSPDMLNRRRQMAAAFLQQGMDTSPIVSPWQGAARLADALVGGLSMRRADQQEQAARDAANAQLMAAMQGGQMTPEALGQIISNPWASQEQQALAAHLYQSQQPKPAEPFTLGEGQVRYGPNGEVIATGPNKPPSSNDIQEYNFYVQQAQQAGAPGGRILSPLEFWTARDQAKRAQTNVNVQGGPKLNEQQSNTLYYYSHGKSAEAELAPVEKALTQFGGATAAQMPALVANWAKTPEYQVAERAGREFLAAILRKETGAAVTPQEFDYYGPMYLPQPGDKPEVLKRKRLARTHAMDALKSSLGGLSDLTDPIDKQLEEARKQFDMPDQTAQPVPEPQSPQQQTDQPPPGWTSDEWGQLSPAEKAQYHQ